MSLRMSTTGLSVEDMKIESEECIAETYFERRRTFPRTDGRVSAAQMNQPVLPLAR